MTATKERPILFNAEMVRAILEGRKTQTRRPVKPQPDGRVVAVAALVPYDDGAQWCWLNGWDGSIVGLVPRCVVGVGDVLWVREACWLINHQINCQSFSTVSYCADGPKPSIDDRHDAGLLVKVPATHMPRWASRISLEITDVRVQRVSEISEEDAIAEGCGYSKSWEPFLSWPGCPCCGGHGVVGPSCDMSRDCDYECHTPAGHFWALWKSLYPESSPDDWVFAHTLRRIES